MVALVFPLKDGYILPFGGTSMDSAWLILGCFRIGLISI